VHAIGAASDPTMLKRSVLEVAGAGYIACSPASLEMPCPRTYVNAVASLRGIACATQLAVASGLYRPVFHVRERVSQLTRGIALAMRNGLGSSFDESVGIGRRLRPG
jgi:hypothetical protein